MAVTTRRDPDAKGYFGAFGGRFVPETLVEPIEQPLLALCQHVANGAGLREYPVEDRARRHRFADHQVAHDAAGERGMWRRDRPPWRLVPLRRQEPGDP
jgi:tryptophan synthase beta chain